MFKSIKAILIIIFLTSSGCSKISGVRKFKIMTALHILIIYMRPACASKSRKHLKIKFYPPYHWVRSGGIFLLDIVLGAEDEKITCDDTCHVEGIEVSPLSRILRYPAQDRFPC